MIFFMDKNSWRSKFLSQRNLLSRSRVLELSELVEKNVFSLKEFSSAKNIGIYASVRNEVDTSKLISRLFSMGKTVFLPITDRAHKKIYYSEIGRDVLLSPAYFGIPEPILKNPADVSAIDVFLVPGVAFDLRGHRLGYGKGFFDGFFSGHKIKVPRIGLAFDFQVVDELPFEPHDEKMDFVVTEKRVLEF